MLKQIEIANNYSVDEHGRVFNNVTGKEKCQRLNRNGYWTVNLWKNNKPYCYAVHRFVAKGFLENPENKRCVNHIDGNKQNNHVSNLEWCTDSENIKHAYRLGLNKPRIGEDNTASVITEDTANRVCKFLEDGYRTCDICKELNLTKTIVSSIRRGLTWRHVSCKYSFKRKSEKFSVDTVHWICRQIEMGFKNIQIVRLSTNSSVTKSVVSKIRRKCSHTEISKDYNF